MNVNVTKIQRLPNGIIQFYNGVDVVDSFSITSSVSVGFESNLAKTIIFSSSVKTLSFNVFNIIALYGSASNKIYSAGIDPSDTSSAYVNRLYDIYGFLISDVIQGCCPGPTFVGGVVASYPNFASFPATGQQSVIYIDESTNQAYYWDGTSYQLLTSTGVETYPNFASFPVTGMANIIYVDLSVPESYVWDGSVYVSLDGGSVAWGSIIGTLSAQTDLQTALNAKQATLVSGTNIKTVNSTSLLGAGDVSVGTVTSVGVTAGAGISVSGGPITSSGSITVTNSAPDQVVALTAGTGITTSGTYPNFTITNSAPSSGGTVTSVTATLPISSTGGATPNLSMSAADGTTNGYLSSTDWTTFNNKQAALVSGTNIKTINGNTVLGSGNLVVGGTQVGFKYNISVYIGANPLPAAASGQAIILFYDDGSGAVFEGLSIHPTDANGLYAPSFILTELGKQPLTLFINSTSYTTFNNTQAVTFVGGAYRVTSNDYRGTDASTLHGQVGYFDFGTSNSGTVTSVAALTLGTSGADLSSTVATGTTTPVITLNVPTASAANRGALSAADWTTFNNKQAALGFTAVPTTRTISTTSPLSGGGDLSADRTLSIAQATSSINGYLSSIDWNTFNNKQNTLSLTTTGTSGPATLVGATLNIPQYSGGGGGVSAGDAIAYAIALG